MTSSSSSNLGLALSIIGGLTVLWLLLRAAWELAFRVRIYLLSDVRKRVDLARSGPWAVVTGATAGVGKAFAHELAKRGLNVVLISRSLEKLEQVADEVERRHGRSTRVIAMDFTQGSESYAPVRAALQGLEIGILVNNVGMAFPKPVHFLDLPDKFVPDLMNCNMLSMVKMTQIVLPQMVARKKGIIVNVSSLAACRPTPLGLMYSSSKAFMDFFSRGLDMEYRSKGIIVQSLLPGFIDTNMAASLPSCLKISPDVYVRQALNTVGLTNRTSGCLSHSILRLLAETLIPSWLYYSPVGSTLFVLLWKSMKRD